MRTEFNAKLLQYLLNPKKNSEGFTLIEILVSIVIVGILTAIGLPSFLNQANKAREAEARTYIGMINRAQQAYFLQEQGFAPNLAILQPGIPTVTTYYRYDTDGNATEAKSKAEPKPGAIVEEFSGIVWESNGLTYGRVCVGTMQPQPNC